MEKAKKLLKRAYPIMLGALGGFAYYYFIGCSTGSCPISSNPYISTIYGAAMGTIFTWGNKRKDEREDGRRRNMR
jgi:xanthine/uracil permease